MLAENHPSGSDKPLEIVIFRKPETFELPAGAVEPFIEDPHKVDMGLGKAGHWKAEPGAEVRITRDNRLAVRVFNYLEDDDHAEVVVDPHRPVLRRLSAWFRHTQAPYRVEFRDSRYSESQ